MASDVYVVTVVGKPSSRVIELRLRPIQNPADRQSGRLFALMALRSAVAPGQRETAGQAKKAARAPLLKQAAKWRSNWPTAAFVASELSNYVVSCEVKSHANKTGTASFNKKMLAALEEAGKEKDLLKRENRVCKTLPNYVLRVEFAKPEWTQGIEKGWVWGTTAYDCEAELMRQAQTAPPAKSAKSPKSAANGSAQPELRGKRKGDFSGARIQDSFWGAWPNDEVSDVSAANFANATFTAVSLREINFRKCNFSGAVFLRARQSSSTFERCDFSQACFAAADLRGIRFQECNLDGCDFRGARLDGTVFYGGSMRKANVQDTPIGKTTIPADHLATMIGAPSQAKLQNSACTEFDRVISAAKSVEFSIDFAHKNAGKELARLSMSALTGYSRKKGDLYRIALSCGLGGAGHSLMNRESELVRASSFAAALRKLAAHSDVPKQRTLLKQTLTLSSAGASVKGKALAELCLRALGEVFTLA